MHATGIIVEFNPLHDGHIAHLRETRAKFGGKIIAAMSGNFVQRGEPAICDKWHRTRMALHAGVDIVLEIPVPYVVSGADYFARASVGILAATGVVNALSFGSECGDIAAISEAGRVLADEPSAYKAALRESLDSGASFAAARGAALARCVKNAPDGLFTKPNNTLATEYCKALRLLGDPFEIFSTHRASGGPSATKIRKKIFEKKSTGYRLTPVDFFAPKFAQEILENSEIVTLDDFTEIFRYLLYTREFDLGEGLENRFRKFCGDFEKISDFLAAAKTKRYTHTRLQRAVLGMLLGIGAAEMAFFEANGGAQYIRVLGFRRESADLLSALTKKAALPVITHGAAIDAILAGESGDAAAKMLAKEFEAGDIYRNATRAPGGFRSERAAELVII